MKIGNVTGYNTAFKGYLDITTNRKSGLSSTAQDVSELRQIIPVNENTKLTIKKIENKYYSAIFEKSASQGEIIQTYGFMNEKSAQAIGNAYAKAVKSANKVVKVCLEFL